MCGTAWTWNAPWHDIINNVKDDVVQATEWEMIMLIKWVFISCERKMSWIPIHWQRRCVAVKWPFNAFYEFSLFGATQRCFLAISAGVTMYKLNGNKKITLMRFFLLALPIYFSISCKVCLRWLHPPGRNFSICSDKSNVTTFYLRASVIEAGVWCKQTRNCFLQPCKRAALRVAAFI